MNPRNTQVILNCAVGSALFVIEDEGGMEGKNESHSA